jgi:hypothetical protein
MWLESGREEMHAEFLWGDFFVKRLIEKSRRR